MALESVGVLDAGHRRAANLHVDQRWNLGEAWPRDMITRITIAAYRCGSRPRLLWAARPSCRCGSNALTPSSRIRTI